MVGVVIRRGDTGWGKGGDVCNWLDMQQPIRPEKLQERK
jgi:hypothetical protein